MLPLRRCSIWIGCYRTSDVEARVSNTTSHSVPGAKNSSRKAYDRITISTFAKAEPTRKDSIDNYRRRIERRGQRYSIWISFRPSRKRRWIIFRSNDMAVKQESCLQDHRRRVRRRRSIELTRVTIRMLDPLVPHLMVRNLTRIFWWVRCCERRRWIDRNRMIS